MSEINDQEQIIKDFSRFDSWEEKYKYLIKLAKEVPAFPEEHRKEDNQVKGCQSQVWLFASLEGSQVKFVADSDAMIVKGLIALLLKIYSNKSPQEILQTEPSFFKEIGLDQHLSMNRANGLAAMVKQMKFYALAFQSILSK
ncbi:MAG TPA: SufE family protein [Vampirovibrionales bacterium]